MVRFLKAPGTFRTWPFSLVQLYLKTEKLTNISKFQVDREFEGHEFISWRLLCVTLVKQSLFCLFCLIDCLFVCLFVCKVYTPETSCMMGISIHINSSKRFKIFLPLSGLVNISGLSITSHYPGVYISSRVFIHVKRRILYFFFLLSHSGNMHRIKMDVMIGWSTRLKYQALIITEFFTLETRYWFCKLRTMKDTRRCMRNLKYSYDQLLLFITLHDWVLSVHIRILS